MAARSTRQPYNSGVSATPGHIPVLLNEVIDALNPRDGGIYVDGTLGGGGYARALLDAADCTVLGIDRDPGAIALLEHYASRAEAIDAKRFGEVFQRRATLARHWRHFLQDYPVVLMPVSAELPFKQDADLEGGDAVARLWEAQPAPDRLPGGGASGSSPWPRAWSTPCPLACT